MHGVKIDKKFSQETAIYWLRYGTGFRPWMEIIALLRGIDLPKIFRKDFYYKRLRMADEDANGTTNDVFGAIKNYKIHEVDRLVMFKHLEKGFSFVTAFTETLTFLNSRLSDIMRLITILRNRYSEDENVLGYLDALEEFNDG